MSKGIYKFEVDFHYAEILGVFIATEKEVKKAIGGTVYLGEVAGKHSEVDVELGWDCIKLISNKAEDISKIEALGLIIGTNPIEELQEQEEDEEDNDV